MQHHKGNADRPDEHGETVDWISIYKHGEHGEAEHPLKYAFLNFFREDPKTVFKQLKRKDPREAFWGIFELASFVTTFVILGILNWHYICFLLPFWYFGHCLSYLNGYYRHYGGNPDEPIAWGVSTYDKLYNWTWFYNGYHAEHHLRPKVHWTRMQALRDQIIEQQRAARVRVIKVPRALGFLDPDLPPHQRSEANVKQNPFAFSNPGTKAFGKIKSSRYNPRKNEPLTVELTSVSVNGRNVAVKTNSVEPSSR